jgi:hypothetical protein
MATDDVLVERPADGTAVVVFSGEHDLASAPEVRELLDFRCCSRTTWSSPTSPRRSSSTRRSSEWFSRLRRERLSSGRLFRLQLHTTDIVRRAFEILGVFSVVEHVATRDEALMRDEM